MKTLIFILIISPIILGSTFSDFIKWDMLADCSAVYKIAAEQSEDKEKEELFFKIADRFRLKATDMIVKHKGLKLNHKKRSLIVHYAIQTNYENEKLYIEKYDDHSILNINIGVCNTMISYINRF